MAESRIVFNDDEPNPEAFIQALKKMEIAGELLVSLNERSEEIADTDIDLSASDQCDLYYVAQAIVSVYKKGNLDEDLPINKDEYENYSIDKIKLLPKDRLKGIFEQIVRGYRSSAFNLVIGIGDNISYTKEQLLPQLAPPRENSHDVVEQIIEGELIPVINNGDLPRAQIQVKIDEISNQAHNAWAPLFDDKSEKMLAKSYLKGEVSRDEMVLKRDKLPQIKYRF